MLWINQRHSLHRSQHQPPTAEDIVTSTESELSSRPKFARRQACERSGETCSFTLLKNIPTQPPCRRKPLLRQAANSKPPTPMRPIQEDLPRAQSPGNARPQPSIPRPDQSDNRQKHKIKLILGDSMLSETGARNKLHSERSFTGKRSYCPRNKMSVGRKTMSAFDTFRKLLDLFPNESGGLIPGAPTGPSTLARE